MNLVDCVSFEEQIDMQMRGCLVGLMLLIATLLLNVPPSFSQDPDLVRHFDYDRKAPLAIKEIGDERRGNVRVLDITYASPKGGVVPAYLVVPEGKGPFAAVVWGHWYWGNSPMRNRKEFLEEAVVLAQAGVVSLLTDGPIARPGYVPITDPLSEQNPADLLQQVVDMRRGVDLLLARKDVDAKRIAYVGHSYNALVGAILSGVDRRFKAFVLMAGPLSRELDVKTPEYQGYRDKVGSEKFDGYMNKYYYLDEGKYVSHAAPAFIFMQFATQEKFLTAERARQYEAIVSEPKKFKLYEAPHALNAAATRDRIAFLTEQLKLKPLPASVVASIPELYQPPAN
jgi:dienelactone hydrolase